MKECSEKNDAAGVVDECLAEPCFDPSAGYECECLRNQIEGLPGSTLRAEA
jgi:hypothetical protein